MARLYFSFRTNLPDSSEDKATPSVDYICLYENDKPYSLSCNWESDWDIQDGVFEARFKGVDILDEMGDFREVTSKDVEDIKALLKKIPLPKVELGLYLYDETYPELGEIKAEHLHFCLVAGDEEVEGHISCSQDVIVCD